MTIPATAITASAAGGSGGTGFRAISTAARDLATAFTRLNVLPVPAG
jgi:hypothetical protein